MPEKYIWKGSKILVANEKSNLKTVLVDVVLKGLGYF